MPLIAAAELSRGATWPDVVLSFALLAAAAAMVLRRASGWLTAPATHSQRWVFWLLAVLALYPGHLANLQWGWQVAVFLAIAGATTSIVMLTRADLSWRDNIIGLAGAALALGSFATGVAAIPTALVLVALRCDLPARRRLVLGIPWLLLGVAAAWLLARPGFGGEIARTSVLVRYVLNFIGGGIARFATDLAPLVALAGIAFAASIGVRERRNPAAWPWIGCALFGLMAAVLTAGGRAPAYGAAQAFVTRYVSFSVFFWLGIVGLVGVARSRARSVRGFDAVLVLIALMAVINAAHLVRKAARLGARANDTAMAIRRDWPAVDDALLGEIYFEQPAQARERLELLDAWGYPPFDRKTQVRAAKRDADR